MEVAERPEFFGRYTLLDRIAVGGMAELYRARVAGTDGFSKYVALKRVLPQHAREEDFTRMLIDEAKLVSSMSHPNIVQVIDLGRIAGIHFIAMEYVHGQPLSHLLRRCSQEHRPLPLAISLHIAIEVLRGLDYAHNLRAPTGDNLGIIHRDVSPQNVLISYDGHVKLIDFGIAKARDALSRTKTGVIKGKIGYMSPEQAQSQPVDARSDQYSAAVMLWEMLTLKRAYGSGDEIDVLKRVITGRIRSFDEVGAEVPTPLRSALERALDHNPQQRFQSCKDFANELSRFLNAAFPDFQPDRLAELMQKYFAPEIEEDRGRLQAMETQLLSGDVPFHALTPSDTRRIEPTTSSSSIERLAGGRRALVVFIAAALALLAAGALALWIGLSRSGGDDLPPRQSVVVSAINVETEPAGASVAVDGEAVTGVTPLTLSDLEVGRTIAVRVERDGYQPFERSFVVAREPRPISIALTPLPRTLRVVGAPEGAAVKVGTDTREATGDDPLVFEVPSDQALAVEVTAAGFAPYRVSDLEGAPGAKVDVEIPPLQPLRSTRQPRGHGLLQINCQPWCHIYIDGKDTGLNSPQKGIKLSAGRHRLRVVHTPTGAAREETVTIKANETLRRIFML